MVLVGKVGNGANRKRRRPNDSTSSSVAFHVSSALLFLLNEIK